jgi:RNA polymerase sigma factor for flagellar operon FliA
VEPADLVSYGIFGLIDAIEKFQLDRGVRFETYAGPRIRGAILDELRSIDWVPRSLRAKARTIERAESALEGRLGRSPTDDELATAAGMSTDQLNDALTQVSSAMIMALDDALVGAGRDGPLRLSDSLASTDHGPGHDLERRETRRLLHDAILTLPERHRLVLGLYYAEGLTLAEIGRVLNVTESRVCQIHARAVLQLRGRLADVLSRD